MRSLPQREQDSCAYFKFVGKARARTLARQWHYRPLTTHPSQLVATLCPGDVLLVEGKPISNAISTCAVTGHAALYVGRMPIASIRRGETFWSR